MTIRPFQVVSIQKVCEANKRSLRFLVKAMVDKLLKKVRYVCKRVCGCLTIYLSLSACLYTSHDQVARDVNETPDVMAYRLG